MHIFLQQQTKMFTREVGTLQDVIQYFNTHPSLFQREDRDRGHMQRVMTVLTQQNMQNLQKQFQLYPQGLELPTFIYLIKKLYKTQHDISRYFFVSDLIKFFQAIDINGDGHLQWSQFTQYIIQNIKVVQRPKYKNKIFQQNQIISTAYSKISTQYRFIKTYDIGCQYTIKKILFYEELKNYYVIEQQTHSIKIFNNKFIYIDSIKLEVQNIKSTIIDFSIDRNKGIVGCIFQDALWFCNLKLRGAGNAISKQDTISYQKYNKIQYLKQHQVWAIASKTGELQLCTIMYPNRTCVTFKVLTTLNNHQSAITEIIQLEQPKAIATCSMDGNIKLYSKHLDKYYIFQPIAQHKSSIVNQNRKKGILGISNSNQFGNYVLSFGFSHYVYVYSLDISITKGYVGKYTQHTGVILWAKFIKMCPYVLSFDDKMNMRIWDYRKFQTMQLINCQKIFINPTKLQIIPQLSQVLICEKKVTQFRAHALQKKSKQINQFHNIYDFKFCPLTNQIFIFTSNDVRVYNYFTGNLKKLFTKLHEEHCQTNITACQFGFKCKRFFIGDAGGFVRQLCSQTGEQLQNIDSGDQLNYQNKQISRIIFMKEHSLLVCCSIDGRIMIYQRKQYGQYLIVRDIRQSHEQFVCAATSDRYCLLATAGDNGNVVIWNLQKYTLDGICVLDEKPVGITFSPIHPIIIVASQNGYLNLIYVKPYEGKYKYKCFAKLSINQMYQIQSPMRITSFSCQLIFNAYFPKQCILNRQTKKNYNLIAAVGSNKGNILLINLNYLLQKYKVEQNHQVFSIKTSHRCQVQVVRTLIINQRNQILQNGYTNDIKQINYLKQCIHSIINVSQDPIQNVLISKQCSTIFCKSTDKKLKVYSLKNQYNGAINFTTFKKIFWKIPQLNFYKKLQAIDMTIYSIRLIQNKNFQKDQENKIKVQLLLNQYLDNKEKQKYYDWLSAKNNNCQVILSKSKFKKIQSHEGLSEQQFNQIYLKLKNSIEKSLQSYNNTEKIFWEKTKIKNKAMLKQREQTQVQSSNQLVLQENNKPQTKQKKSIKKSQRNLLKIKTKSAIKRDHCFELFGKKSEFPKKKQQTKKKNLLFTPLGIAKKMIMSNFSVTAYR